MRPQMLRPEKEVSAMPKTSAQARPANLGQTLRRLLDLAADNLRTTQELEVSDL